MSSYISDAAPGNSSGQAQAATERIAAETLPLGFAFVVFGLFLTPAFYVLLRAATKLKPLTNRSEKTSPVHAPEIRP